MIELTLQKRAEGSISIDSLVEGYVSANWWPELHLDLNLQGIAADFYLLYAVKDGDAKLTQAFDEYTQVVAKQIAVYLDAACGGELRYKQFDGLKQGSRSIARRDWRERRLSKGINLLRGGSDNFHNGGWGGGYGGPAWGAIIDLLIAHLEGKVSNTLFVDQALALEHNGGQVFNKLYQYWVQDSLKEVLDANLNQNWERLLKYGSPWARKIFMEWITAEEDLVVKNFDVSRPRRAGTKTNNNGVVLPKHGQLVMIGFKSRVIDWRGQWGKVVGMRTRKVKKLGTTTDVLVNRGGVEKWFEITKIEFVPEVKGTEIEYIG